MDAVAGKLEQSTDFGKTPAGKVKRWKLEIKLADKREDKWRKQVKSIYDKYRQKEVRPNSFNILWSNTETIRPSLYNSLPQPNVRRRYQDDDKLGKAVSEVLERSLEFSQETSDFDGLMKGDVLCMVLAGRSVSRVRYVPDIRESGQGDANKEAIDDESDESETYEEIEWEQAVAEKVQWDDFRILCAAKCWDEVTAIGFRHRMGRDELIEKFGEEVGKKVTLDAVEDEDVKKSNDVADLFKTAEVWEIWDKDEKEVLFICLTSAEPLKEQDDPLGLQGFFPIPRPLYAVEDDSSLVPTPLFELYRQQAEELDRVSKRINKLIEACKVRGIYDSTLSEMEQLTQANDTMMVPCVNATAMIERGGLEKAIWMMPVDMIAKVLQILQLQRDASKAIVYEITGMSDIIRGVSDPRETAAAQGIKAKWGATRLQKLQREVQRYIRDIIRIKAEIIAEKFQPETLEKQTLCEYPHEAEVQAQYQQQMMQWHQQTMQMQQQAMQQPPQGGMPPPQGVPQQQPPAQMPPPPQYPDVVTWEKIVSAMRDDATRTFRIDIETDSTIAESQESDMAGLKEVLGGVAAVMTAFAPAVDRGALPIEAVKEIILTIVRRAKLGSAVEDALEKMQQPQPQPDPHAAQAQIEQQKMQQQAQADQAKLQGQAQLEQMKAGLADQQHQRELAANQAAQDAEANRQMQMELHKQQIQAEQVQHQNELEAQREMQKQQLEVAAKQRESELKATLEQQRLEFDKWKAELEANTTVVVAEISAKTQLQTAKMSADTSAGLPASDGTEESPLAQLLGVMNENLTTLMDVQNKHHADIVATMSKPKTIVRDPVTNRVKGIQ